MIYAFSGFWINSGLGISQIVSPQPLQFSLCHDHFMIIGSCFTLVDHQFVLFHGYLGTLDAHPAPTADQAIGSGRICLAIASLFQSLPSRMFGRTKIVWFQKGKTSRLGHLSQ
jgi:hypothetical protein